jgi:hypothetical protein
MNLKTILILVVPLLVVSLWAEDPATTPAAPTAVTSSPEIALRYVSAVNALTALLKKLGPDGINAVAQADLKRNVLTLDEKHPQAAQAREILAALDHKPEELKVTAIVKRHWDAPVPKPPGSETIARHLPITPVIIPSDQILMRPTILTLMDRPVRLRIPEGDSSLEIEIQVGRP